MKVNLSIRNLILISTSTFYINGYCNKPPFIAEYNNVKGQVLAREFCKDDSLDYWLIDLSYIPGTPQLGDTVILNSIEYRNVIKTKDLNRSLKKFGTTVSLDYKAITANKIQSDGCTVSNPITYPLKELFIIHQFEIR